MAYKAENIMTDIVSTLGTITATNGYENTVTNITLWAAVPNEEDIPTVFPALVVVNGTDDFTDGKMIMNRRLHPRIRAYADSRTAPSSSINSLSGDVMKAMFADRTRGGNSHNTVLMSNTPIEEEEKPYAASELLFEIWFESTETAP